MGFGNVSEYAERPNNMPHVILVDHDTSMMNLVARYSLHHRIFCVGIIQQKIQEVELRLNQTKQIKGEDTEMAKHSKILEYMMDSQDIIINSSYKEVICRICNTLEKGMQKIFGFLEICRKYYIRRGEGENYLCMD